LVVPSSLVEEEVEAGALPSGPLFSELPSAIVDSLSSVISTSSAEPAANSSAQ
jgi:hypothetical protein